MTVPRAKKERNVGVIQFIPQAGISRCVVGQIIDVPGPQIQEQSIDDVRVITQERVHPCTMERAGETVKAIQLVPQDRIQEDVVQEVVDVCVPRLIAEIIEVAKHVPQERVQSNTVEQIVDVAVREIPEQTVDVVNVVPQERVRQYRVQQIVDMRVLQAFKRLNMTRKNRPLLSLSKLVKNMAVKQSKIAVVAGTMTDDEVSTALLWETRPLRGNSSSSLKLETRKRKENCAGRFGLVGTMKSMRRCRRRQTG